MDFPSLASAGAIDFSTAHFKIWIWLHDAFSAHQPPSFACHRALPATALCLPPSFACHRALPATELYLPPSFACHRALPATELCLPPSFGVRRNGAIALIDGRVILAHNFSILCGLLYFITMIWTGKPRPFRQNQIAITCACSLSVVGNW